MTWCVCVCVRLSISALCIVCLLLLVQSVLLDPLLNPLWFSLEAS